MNINDKHAILLGRYEAWMKYAIEGLKGETIIKGYDLAEYLEKRIRQSHEEINNNQYEHWNNSKRDKEITESNTEAVAGEI
jgi:hypothetical protein